MSYVDSNLMKDERVVYRAKLHWIVFLHLKALLTLFIAPLIQRSTSEFAVTNRRLIVKLGLISRRTVELNLSKIESIEVHQTVFGRLLDYGTISVNGTGGTLESFNAIAQPLEFRRAVLQAAEVAPNLRTALSERERVA